MRNSSMGPPHEGSIRRSITKETGYDDTGYDGRTPIHWTFKTTLMIRAEIPSIYNLIADDLAFQGDQGSGIFRKFWNFLYLIRNSGIHAKFPEFCFICNNSLTYNCLTFLFSFSELDIYLSFQLWSYLCQCPSPDLRV